MTPGPRPGSPRYYDLDALRAVAMMLGIVLHTALFVLPEPVSQWPLYDEGARGAGFYRHVIDVIHGFRMPVFFLLSGFFTALLWQRRGLRALWRQRLQRVGIPFIASCLIVLPASILALTLAAGRQEPYDFPYWVLPLVWVQNLGHLWFLWYLLLLVGCLTLAVRLGARFQHPLAGWLAIPVSAGLALFMQEPVWGSDTAESLLPELPLLGYYFCFFVLGVVFYQRNTRIRAWWTVALLPAIGAYLLGNSLLKEYQAGVPVTEIAPQTLFRDPLTLASAFYEVAFAWLMVFGTMGLFRWVASRESQAWRYLSDASYWMYLSHLPLVVLLQWLVVDWPLHYHLKFLLVCCAVTATVLVSYQWAVRYTFLGKALNGPRTRPVKG